VLVTDSIPNARLVWRAPTGGGAVAGYHVFRRQIPDAAVQLTSAIVPDTTFTDSLLVGGTFCYHVRAVTPDAQLGAASDSVCITYTPPATVGAPVAVSVTAADTLVAGATYGAAAYAFDAGSGQVLVDATSNGNTGQLGSAAGSDSNDPAWVAGIAGSALRFDGSNDRVRALDSASLRLAGSFTLEAWVRRGSTGTTDCILDLTGWNPDWQEAYTLDPMKLFQDGDVWHLECRWDNSQENQPVIGGIQRDTRDIPWGTSLDDDDARHRFVGQWTAPHWPTAKQTQSLPTFFARATDAEASDLLAHVRAILDDERRANAEPTPDEEPF
jgi:hypothetical protein